MNIVKTAFAVIWLVFTAANVYADAHEYKILSNSVRQNPTIAAMLAKNGDQVQLLEFFSYGCAACARFEPLFEQWLKSNKGKYIVERMPVTFNQDEWQDLANLYFIMQDLSPNQNFNNKIFEALQQQDLRLWEKSVMKQFVMNQGFTAEQFERAYAQYKNNVRAEKSDQISDIYGVNHTPTLIVNGPQTSYVITSNQNDNDFFQVLNHVLELASTPQN